MKFLELIDKRQSDRKYISKEVENNKLLRCLEAARMAPSASNSQPWTFVVLNDPEIKNNVAKHTYGPLKSFNAFVPQAPIIIAIVQEKSKIVTELGGRLKSKEYALIDIGIAAEHLCLQAAEEGLGSCMLGWFNEKEVKTLLNVPKNKSIPLLITLGYTPEGYLHRRKIRKDFDKVVKWNKF